MTADQASGPLAPERNESIFRNDIIPDYLPGTITPTERPRLILLGGQPGAGKTAVLIASHAELEQSGATVRIVGDDLRSYHPRFLMFQRQDPETASQFTQLDAGRWAEKLLAVATERKVNIVFETTMRTPENVARVIGMARNAGYEVEASAVAVNPRLSWQGNHFRFEEMLRLGDAARIPPKHIHDAAVDGLRTSLEKIESEQLVDRVQLSTRGGTILYDNEVREGQWSQQPGARRALEAEQSRPMDRSELQRFADDWSYVLTRMEERKADPERIAHVRAQAVDDVNYFLTQRREADGENARQSRTIFERRSDALGLFVELYDNAVRDAERRPIGNVEAHAAGRLAQSYTALRLVEAARDLGLLPENSRIIATRAMVQDKRASREFPAAHRLPADLSVEMPDGTRKRLTEYFGVALNRSAIDRDVFSPTDRMARLANVADSWLESAGMRKTLAQAANRVSAGTMSADEAMTKIVGPGYAAAIDVARRKLARNMGLAERTAIATSLVDATGEPLRAMRDDLRLRTNDIANRDRAKAMMEAVLTETARHTRLQPAKRRTADVFVQGIAENERNLGPVRDIVPGSGLPLVPARDLPDLSEAEIDARLQNSARLAEKRAEIDNLARLVFGNNRAVSSSLLTIRDARTGAAAGDDVREGRLSELAGEGKGWFRAASPARQTAEAHAPQLAAALADYGHAMDFERHQIVMHHREDQARQRVEVPLPSPKLSALMLIDDRQVQLQRLNGDPAMRRELETLTVAMTRRFSPSDRADLKAGNLGRLTTSLGISRERGALLKSVQEQARILQGRTVQERRDLSRGNTLEIRR